MDCKLHDAVPVFSCLNWIVIMIVEDNALVLEIRSILGPKVGDIYSGLSGGAWISSNILPEAGCLTGSLHPALLSHLTVFHSWDGCLKR